MGDSIDHVHILDESENPRINSADLRKLIRKYEDQFPENCFLEDLAPKGDQDLPITDAMWCDTGSRDSWKEVFLKKVAPKIKGRLELVAVWESGGAEGVRILNGVVERCEVEYRLKKSK